MSTCSDYGAATWNQRFAVDDYVFGRDPNEYLRTQAGRIRAGGRVLCVADGEGRNSVWLAGQGLQVEAFDISEVGVAKARKLALDAKVTVEFHIAGCDDWTWRPEVYDAVVAVFVQFADPAMRARMFSNMLGTLAPGGILILQGYTPRQLEYKTGGPSQRSHLYTAELLRQAFASLEMVDLVEYEAELHEGARHTGRSALVGCVARKPAAAQGFDAPTR
ncbi:MAG: class I SAM-dependent methyltransferase [Variovorax sp.]